MSQRLYNPTQVPFWLPFSISPYKFLKGEMEKGNTIVVRELA